MGDVLRLVRAPNLLIAAAGVLAGSWVALERLAVPLPLLAVWAALSGVGLGAAGNVLNDLRDAPADRVNRPDRPLAAGRIAPGSAHLLVFLGTLGGLAAAALVSGAQLVAGLGALAVMIVYSPLLKRRGLLGNGAVALVAGLPLFYGALAVGRPAAGIIPWILAGWLHLVREIVKDLADEPGDRAAGRRTLPITRGRERAVTIVLLLIGGFLAASYLLPWAAAYRDAYFAMAAIAQLLCVLAIHQLRRGRLAPAAAALKGAMVAGVVALVAGRVA
ncbi:MAG: geranylgeranylglycerol-phosphate geranylgeranyltransferase [Gemmatimonadales bacterium]